MRPIRGRPGHSRARSARRVSTGHRRPWSLLSGVRKLRPRAQACRRFMNVARQSPARARDSRPMTSATRRVSLVVCGFALALGLVAGCKKKTAETQFELANGLRVELAPMTEGDQMKFGGVLGLRPAATAMETAFSLG